MCVTHSHLALPLQLLEEVVRLELFLLLLVRQHAGDLEVNPRYLVLKHAQTRLDNIGKFQRQFNTCTKSEFFSTVELLLV